MTDSRNQQIYQLILKAIKDTDRGFFFIADHQQQAANVIRYLESSGYRIVPNIPSEKNIEKAVEKINMGLNDPKRLVFEIYQNLLE